MDDTTHFASAERSTSEEIKRENKLVSSQKDFSELFGAMTGIGGVIDKNRQIVYANNELLKLLGLNSLEPILGKRPGEFVSCIHLGENNAGCGTTNACAYCGAVNVIIESQRTGKKAMRETQISSVIDGKHRSWDLNVISTPVNFGGEIFYILILQDISDEKRRTSLERIFFHDLLNSVGSLNGLLNILREETDPAEIRELINLSEEISRNIVDEILMQRQIRAAENNELKVKIESVNSIEILDSSIAKISFHEAVKTRSVRIADDSVNIDFETDRVLLQRVIINLLKNALEATEMNGTVLVGVRKEENKVVLWVKNDKLIPMDVQFQLFQRSFSTKGSGRGLGTYSIRLLTENYLNGNVSFVSNETDRTIFRITLNQKFPS
jgi:signal transduction histidine kinase